MINPQLETLMFVQEADLDIARLRREIDALPKRLAELEKKLAQEKLALEQAEKAIKEEEAKRRRLESDIKDQQQKIHKFREQTSSVKTNEQYAALQHEIGFAETEIRRIEDRELESMERSEQLEAQRTKARQELADQTRVVELEKEAAHGTSAEQQAKLASLIDERTRLRANVDEDLLARYDRVAGARGTGLARVQGQRCLGCQMALRPQAWNQVRAGEILPCESCARLLYYDPELEPAHEEPPAKAKKRKADPDAAEEGAGV
jgi:predicted  nucleic acid-binding Zn-ribbon protein